MSELDLVIRGGSIVDGTGAPARTADVAVSDGRIAEVGRVTGKAKREIDADGALVTPGWVDIHTHYDAQLTWDNHLAPSSWHGVTTVVVGNCGVGFAPVHDQDHDRLIEIMEGVEDIPGTAMHEGLKWGWTSFAEYLDATEAIAHDIDFGVYVPHNSLRLFVMGDRGAAREPATEADIEIMGQLVREGIEAGALGFSTDRIIFHKTSRNEHTPAYGAAGRECIGLARTAGAAGSGVLQLVSDFDDIDEEFDMLVAMVEQSGMPLGFTLTYRHEDVGARRVRGLLERTEKANARGLSIVGQVAPRAIGLLYGLGCTLNPFSTNRIFKEIEPLPPAERARAMKDGEFRRRLFANLGGDADFRVGSHLLEAWDRMYEVSDPPNYEPDLGDSVAAIARREGRSPEEVVYDILIKDDGASLIYLPTVNYRDGNFDVLGEMLEHPYTLPGLSDGGAHVGSISDGSFPTTLLTYWGRDRSYGRIDIPFLVKKQAADTAHFVGLVDRGVLAPGYRADINVIDFDRLSVAPPEVHSDLPAGGSRLMQRANGYLFTIVSGEAIFEDGVATGALPGRLVRGRQQVPA